MLKNLFPFGKFVSYSFLFLLSSLVASCQTQPKAPQRTDDGPRRYDSTVQVAPYSDSFPLIVFKKPKVSSETFKKWIDSINPTVRFFCQTCDSNLVALGGPGPQNFITGQTISSPSPGTGGKPSGEDSTVYYSANFNIQIPFDKAEKLGNKNDYKLDTPFSDNPVIVAVFDTGLDPDLFKNNMRWFASVSNTCMPGGERGWNFHDNNAQTFDDYSQKHGSLVSSFIIQQAKKYHKNDVRILPVKIHGSDGSSNLFQVLCGIAYAQKAGAKIINASFGYYTFGNDTSTLLFEEYIKTYLTNNNILMVCAAGNADADAERAVRLPGNRRDLMVNPFYPASFSDKLDNVIATTTVSNVLKTVSPTQNFSKIRVDVGVIRDNDNTASTVYGFANPLLKMPEFVFGSSFAAPIVTGIIASHYDQLFPGGMANAASIKSALKQGAFPESQSIPVIDTFIKKGKSTHK